MTYDEVEAARIKFKVEEITARARRQAVSYRAIRHVLWLADSYPKSTVLEAANRVRVLHTGVNLVRFRKLMEALTGEKLCW